LPCRFPGGDLGIERDFARRAQAQRELDDNVGVPGVAVRYRPHGRLDGKDLGGRALTALAQFLLQVLVVSEHCLTSLSPCTGDQAAKLARAACLPWVSSPMVVRSRAPYP